MRSAADVRKTDTTGLVLHWASRYDLLVWILMRGKERVFREKLLHLANIKRGEAVLDVGCGTGTLAIAAKRLVGATAAVHGIDASDEVIARAKMKAGRASVNVDFRQGIAEALHFPDEHFDVVLSTVMLHHLGPKSRRECAREILRVLKPGGRWLVVDFEGPARHAGGILSLFHRHGHIKPGDLNALVADAGLSTVEKGPVGYRNLHFVLAAAPSHR